jgi:hypothetical protein
MEIFCECLSMNRLFLYISIILIHVLTGVLGQDEIALSIQVGHYTPGLINIRDWAAMPPGLLVLDYNAYYWSNKYFAQDVTQVKTIPLSLRTVRDRRHRQQ